MMRRWRFHLFAMSVLTALFVGRVGAQLLQAIHPVGWIPAFDVWHSGVLPYPYLLASQLCIIGLMSFCLHRVRNGAIRSGRWKYWMCFYFGGAYFAFMAFRWIAGLTFLADDPWFSRTLPAFFHLVLAGFILLLGSHILAIHRRRRTFGRSSRR